uniref:Uncharacterized protein n=1 Tax=Vombatus ursinus TaxID=29139 RepID=A0A4X2L5N4_VOMUR
MATVTKLKAVLKNILEKKGVLGHLRAKIRAEVFNALDDQGEKPRPLSHENLLTSVLTAESGQQYFGFRYTLFPMLKK